MSWYCPCVLVKFHFKSWSTPTLCCGVPTVTETDHFHVRSSNYQLTLVQTCIIGSHLEFPTIGVTSSTGTPAHSFSEGDCHLWRFHYFRASAFCLWLTWRRNFCIGFPRARNAPTASVELSRVLSGRFIWYHAYYSAKTIILSPCFSPDPTAGHIHWGVTNYWSSDQFVASDSLSDTFHHLVQTFLWSVDRGLVISERRPIFGRDRATTIYWLHHSFCHALVSRPPLGLDHYLVYSYI